MSVAEATNRLSAVELAGLIRNRRVTARKAVEDCLAAIASGDANLHAFITVAAGSALAEADRLDSMAAEGRFTGSLHGVPVAIKDLIPTAGIRTTRGSLAHKDDVPAVDDLIVGRIRQAGGIVIGKTNTPEFGFGALCRNELAGNTANPYAPGRTSGGSSGGSAVAVATGMAHLTLGTDFGGSVRTPASFCNVVGFRPGAGLVPKVPKTFLWETLASYGIMARSVGDVSLMLDVIVGGDVRDPASLGFDGLSRVHLNAERFKVAMSIDLGIATISQEVAEVVERAASRIGSHGIAVEHAHPDFTDAQDAFETLRAAMLFHDFGAMIDDPAIAVAATVRWNVERGRNLLATDIFRAEATRARIYQNCVAFFERFDFLVLPAASVAPWPLDQADVESIDGKPLRNIVDYLTITYTISLVGLPVLSLPCGWTADGLPIGMQIVAGPRREAELLAFAGHLEERLGFRHSFPDERT